MLLVMLKPSARTQRTASDGTVEQLVEGLKLTLTYALATWSRTHGPVSRETNAKFIHCQSSPSRVSAKGSKSGKGSGTRP
jgi:hypothetical protein